MDFQQDNAVDQAMASLVGSIRLGRRLGRRSYAVSLIWSPVEADGSKLREQARAAAARTEAGLIALRAGGGVCPDQYALGDRSLQQKPGMPALAACVAEPLSGSLCGAWLLSAGIWWLLGVRSDGTILYDRASRDENEIRELFEQGLAGEPWDQIVCPAAWQVSGSQPAEQNAPVIGRSRIKLQTVQLDRARLALWGGCVVVLAVLALVAKSWWPEANEAIPVATATAPAVAPRPLPPPAPWWGQLEAAAVLQVCPEVLLTYAPEAAGIAGWLPKQGQCDGKQVSYQLQRQGGLDHWLVPMAAKLIGQPVVQAGKGDQASLVWQLPGLPAWPDKSAGNADLSVIQDCLTVEFAELGMPAEFVPITGAWPGLRLTLRLNRSPQLLLPLLAPFPATLIREVGYDIEQHGWTLVVEIYGTAATVQ